MDPDELNDVEPARRAGVALDMVQTSRRQWESEHRRPRALTAREALLALQFEVLLVWVAAGNLAAGVELTDEDFERLTIACSRLEAIIEEVTA